MEFVSAGSIVQQAAQQLGLAGAAYADGTVITDPYSSADINIVRLRSLLGTLGQRLRAERQWGFFRQSYVFNTIMGQGDYSLPPDYDRYIDQTGWNRTNRLPLGGPISAQDRAVLKALLVNVTFTVLFDTFGGQFQAYPDNTVLPGGFLLAFEYQMLNWVVQGPVTYSRTKATVYVTNQVVLDNGSYFIALVGGTSAPQAGGLATTPGVSQSDGTVSWMYVPAWMPNTSYSGVLSSNSFPLGFPFSFSAGIATSNFIYANGNIYYCAVTGKSATSGTGPSGNGVGIPEGAAGVAGAALWNWIAPLPQAAQGVPASCNAAAPTQSSDVCDFDQALLVKGLKRAWRIENGWAWTDLMEKDYQLALSAAMAADSVGKVLPLDKRAGGIPLIGQQNVPFTSFGL